MIKSLEALLRGYIFFKVENVYTSKKFYSYSRAKKYKDNVVSEGCVKFLGYHIFKGYRCFYIKTTST